VRVLRSQARKLGFESCTVVSKLLYYTTLLYNCTRTVQYKNLFFTNSDYFLLITLKIYLCNSAYQSVIKWTTFMLHVQLRNS